MSEYYYYYSIGIGLIVRKNRHLCYLNRQYIIFCLCMLDLFIFHTYTHMWRKEAYKSLASEWSIIRKNITPITTITWQQSVTINQIPYHGYLNCSCTVFALTQIPFFHFFEKENVGVGLYCCGRVIYWVFLCCFYATIFNI